MLRTIALVGTFAFLFVTPVFADERGDHGGNHQHGGGNRRAPEPLTMLGLGAGGVGVAYAAWKKRRNAKR